MLSYADLWHEKAGEELKVYVPSATADRTVRMIAKQSGIVGRPFLDIPGRVEICYEGNLHSAVNLVHYVDRVGAAASRLITGYPTITRAVVLTEDLVEVGTFVPKGKQLVVTDPDTLVEWLGKEAS